MKSILKNANFISIILLFMTLSANAQKTVSLFPKDTTQQFISNFGKDSLITLLNERIDTAFKWIKLNASLNDFSTPILEMKLYSKQFQLTDDSAFLSVDTAYKANYAIYDNYIRKLSPEQSAVDSLKEISATIIKSEFRNRVSYLDARIGFALFGKYLNISDSIYIYLYNFAAKSTFENKLQTYWCLAQYEKSTESKNKVLDSCKSKLYLQMYKLRNLKDIYKNELLKPTTAQTLTTNYILPIQTLAYGLFGNNITVNQHGADLMYLLQLQNTDGGFKMYKYKFLESKEVATIYALWSLCEFRDKLLKLE